MLILVTLYRVPLLHVRATASRVASREDDCGSHRDAHERSREAIDVEMFGSTFDAAGVPPTSDLEENQSAAGGCGGKTWQSDGKLVRNSSVSTMATELGLRPICVN